MLSTGDVEAVKGVVHIGSVLETEHLIQHVVSHGIDENPMTCWSREIRASYARLGLSFFFLFSSSTSRFSCQSWNLPEVT
jgi:hypothetical protein